MDARSDIAVPNVWVSKIPDAPIHPKVTDTMVAVTRTTACQQHAADVFPPAEVIDERGWQLPYTRQGHYGSSVILKLLQSGSMAATKHDDGLVTVDTSQLPVGALEYIANG
jgi:hypothetical protein